MSALGRSSVGVWVGRGWGQQEVALSTVGTISAGRIVPVGAPLS